MEKTIWCLKKESTPVCYLGVPFLFLVYCLLVNDGTVFCFNQEYVPVHDGVIAKASWEIEQQQSPQQHQQQVGFNTTTLQTEVAL
jgi:hypothetical protein